MIYIEDRLARRSNSLSIDDITPVGRQAGMVSILGSPCPRGRDIPALRNSTHRFVADGFLRTLAPEGIGPGDGDHQPFELTKVGRTLVAPQQGLSLTVAVRFNGLAEGGQYQPIGSQRKLVKQLTHTRCVDSVFVRIIVQARVRTSNGDDDALLEWRKAATCTHGRVRPDGYGFYRHQDRLYEFFLEYDCGTMSARRYDAKLAAYGDYFASRPFTRDYVGFPTILVVVTSDGAEQRIERAARVAAIGLSAGLPLLLTSEECIHAKSNPGGLFGPIWRTPCSTLRRLWFIVPPVPLMAPRPW